jgi:hypothetical protein
MWEMIAPWTSRLKGKSLLPVFRDHKEKDHGKKDK